MKTELYNAKTQKENGTGVAGRVIRAGGLVVFPTETVYGLGANGLDGEAVAKIFEAKGRPNDNPLILHVAKKSDVRPLWVKIPDTARLLMDEFWPGPLTLVYLKSSIVPDAVTAGLDTVAVRMPEHKTALALIRAAGVPIAAPSANLSGKPSPTRIEHVLEDMDGRVDVMLDGGPCSVGVESTVLSLVGTPTILRPGGVTKEMLESVIGTVKVAHAVLNPLGENEVAASPGMKYRHYAPDCEVVVAEGSPRRAASIINREYSLAESDGKNCIIFATEQTKSYYKGKKYVIIGDRDMPASLCASLFAALRDESGGTDIIFAEAIPAREQGLAYMNRLLRASGFTVLNN
ncbi:MAG: threonylcarbamoyl-AMP synthase [Clostridia bacterium]|nr:threonylcarbamoyl-AMP synthase [Clostridia bacterium]